MFNKIKNAIKKLFGVTESVYTQKQEVRQVVKPVAQVKDWGNVKPVPRFNNSKDPYEIERDKRYAELWNNRVLNFGFIADKQNFKNVRSFVCFAFQHDDYPFVLWQKTRDNEEDLVNGKCVVCGSSGTNQVKEWKKDKKGNTIFNSNEEPIAINYKHHTEAHEVWFYNEKKKYAVLNKILCLCPECHKVAHINMHINNKEKFNELSARYCLVNGLVYKDVNGKPLLDENGNPKLNFKQFKKDFDFAMAEKERRKDMLFNLEISKWVNATPAYKFKTYFEEKGLLEKIPKKVISKKTKKEITVYEWVFRTDRQDFNTYIHKEFISKGEEE